VTSEIRKFVFVFTGPAVDERGAGYQDLMKIIEGIGRVTCKWKLEESHCIPTTATVQISDKT